MYRDANAFNIRLVIPSISMLVLITLILLTRMGWFGRARTFVEQLLLNEEYKAWLMIGLLLLSAFSFGVLAGYVLVQAWW